MMSSSSSTVKFASDEVIDRFLANVDVWLAIFDMLPGKDRIRLEMTNKRLRILMFACWNRATSFDTECVSLRRYDPSMSKIPDNRWAGFVAICVNRIGDRLRSLTITEMSDLIAIWTDNLPSIGKLCPNIERINFVFEGSGRTLDNIRFDSFSRLKTITARGGFMRASPSVFLSIPKSIEVIRGLEGKRDEPFENTAQIEAFFANRPSLREVYLGYFWTRDKSKVDIYRVIAQRCPHLKSIKLPYGSYNCMDYSGVIALESMKELRIRDAHLDEMQIVTICERSPLVEALEFRLNFSSSLGLQSTAMNALSALTKLEELCLDMKSGAVVAPSLVIEFVRELARNSGTSLRHLHLGKKIPLPRAAIEALANGCGKLRGAHFQGSYRPLKPLKNL